ncbi:unnamed protein product [Rotaria sp. Silwood1]|nr:unnamed protein product [Rotaria sp. Silwood1]
MMKDEDRMENHGLITLVFSYLQTWHQTKSNRGKHKQLILNKHILTVKQYITGRDCERKVLIALEFFFNKLKQRGPTEVEMMTMLLQLFFDHHCISMPEIIDWYSNEKFIDQLIGQKVDKCWAEPFINQHGYSIKFTNPAVNELINSIPSSPRTSSVSTEQSSTQSNWKTPQYVRIRKPFKNLVKFFKNLSDTSDVTIHQYVEIQHRKNIDHRVIMIVRCYLKAWNECVSNEKNKFLLSRVSIIEYYKNDPDFEMQILFAIEIFLLQNKKNDNWSIETISTLLQFFLDQNCIKKETILKWNSDGHFYNDVYYKETKGFAQSFIQQLMLRN